MERPDLFYNEIQEDGKTTLVVCRDCGKRAETPDKITHGYMCGVEMELKK